MHGAECRGAWDVTRNRRVFAGVVCGDHRSDQLFYECGVLCGMSCCHTAYYQGGCAKCEQQRGSGGAA